MAAEASWDNAPAPPSRGSSVFGKVLIGCGAALLCFLIALGALIWLVVTKASRAMDRGWAQIHAEVDSLRTEAGARSLYRNNPGLAQSYASEDDFVKAVASWRPKLGEFPDKRPGFKEVVAGRHVGEVSVKTREGEGRKVVTVRVRMSTGSTLVVEIENDKLTDLQVD